MASWPSPHVPIGGDGVHLPGDRGRLSHEGNCRFALPLYTARLKMQGGPREQMSQVKPSLHTPIVQFGLALLVAGTVGFWFSAPAWARQPLGDHPPPPAGVIATPGNGEVVVTWQPLTLGEALSLTEEGLPVPDGYSAKARHRGLQYSCTVSGYSASDCTITGLTNGVRYKVHVWSYSDFEGIIHHGRGYVLVTVTPEP